MLVVNRSVKKEIINEIVGIDFSGCRFVDSKLNGDFSYSIFSNTSFVGETCFDNCNFDFCIFDQIDFQANIALVDLVNNSFKGSNFTGCVFPSNYNTKSTFIETFGIGNVSAETLWIDGTSILAP